MTRFPFHDIQSTENFFQPRVPFLNSLSTHNSIPYPLSSCLIITLFQASVPHFLRIGLLS